jgi:hypothetical protein
MAKMSILGHFAKPHVEPSSNNSRLTHSPCPKASSKKIDRQVFFLQPSLNSTASKYDMQERRTARLPFLAKIGIANAARMRLRRTLIMPRLAIYFSLYITHFLSWTSISLLFTLILCFFSLRFRLDLALITGPSPPLLSLRSPSLPLATHSLIFFAFITWFSRHRASCSQCYHSCVGTQFFLFFHLTGFVCDLVAWSGL